MLGYEYTSPTAEQLAARRQQLDDVGFTAWLSPVILVVSIYVYRHSQAQLFPSSTNQPSTRKHPSVLQVFIRRSTWLLIQPLNQTLGPPYLLLTGVLYFLYLLVLATRNTTNDYMHLTKSLGHVAVSQLPWHYLLAIKSPLSPITLATGLTHERLNAWHRTLGRVIAVLALGHASLYLKFFLDVGVLRKRAGDWDVRLGLMTVTTLSGLLLGSLQVVRKKAYHKGFYVGHVLLSAMLVVLLWAHMKWTRRYVFQMGLWWVVNGVLRWSGSRIWEAPVEEVGAESERQKGLIVLKLTAPEEGGFVEDWIPGQHVYLRLTESPVGSLLGHKNPFTIADCSHDGKRLTLVARRLNGATTMLKDYQAKSLSLEGPYGEATEYMPPLLAAGKSAGQILFIAGGIGVTYTLPIYLALLKARGDTAGLKMLWTIKTSEETQWALQLLKQARMHIDVHIILTQPEKASDMDLSLESGISGLRTTRASRLGKRAIFQDAVEEAMTQPLVKSAQKDKTKNENHDRITVMVCGPASLSNAIRRQVGAHVLDYGREVIWYEEQFGFGG